MKPTNQGRNQTFSLKHRSQQHEDRSSSCLVGCPVDSCNSFSANFIRADAYTIVIVSMILLLALVPINKYIPDAEVSGALVAFRWMDIKTILSHFSRVISITFVIRSHVHYTMDNIINSCIVQKRSASKAEATRVSPVLEIGIATEYLILKLLISAPGSALLR